MYYILLISLLLLFGVNYYIFGRELLCPPVLVSGLFIICCIFGFLEYDKYEYAKYGAKAVAFIIIGLISFTVPSTMIYAFQKRRTVKRKYRQRRRIEIKRSYSIVIALFCWGIDVLYYRSILKIVGTSVFSIAVQRFRILSGEIIQDISPLIGMGTRFIEIFGLIALFILIYNICFDKIQKRDIWIILTIIAWMGLCLITSQRGGILVIICSGIYLSYLFSGMTGTRKAKLNKKFMIIGIILFAGILIFFITSTVFLGRYKTYKDLNILDYLAGYVSNGIRNFDLFLKDLTVDKKLYGQETFSAIYRSIYIYLKKGEFVSRHLEFRNINGINTGNVYTAFRRYYSDFGVLGIAILSAIEGMAFTWGYFYNKRKADEGNICFNHILYTYFVYGVFFMPVDDMFYSRFTVGLIPRVILLYVLYEFIMKIKIRFIKKWY